MRVSALQLTDFRSWPGVDLPLDAGPTALIGANGQGKTNLVEALGYVATLSSHRVGLDAPLVRAGCERAVVRARVERGGRSTLVEIEVNPGRANRARVNRAPVPRAREVVGLLRTVLFAPEDLALVRGDPAERRRFLDELLVQRAPRLAGVRADYERVLKQRNALLKSAAARRRGGGAPELPTLDVWDAHLARTGAELLAARLGLVRALSPHVVRAYDEVAGGPAEPSLGYRSSVPALSDAALSGPALLDPALPDAGRPDAGRPDAGQSGAASADDPWGVQGSSGRVPGRADLEEALLAELRRVRPQELERGISLAGPHRDDLVLRLGDLPVKGYASHGESWSVALALRLASYQLLRGDAAEGDGEPVLVLDDVFAELDTGRRRRLAELVGGAEQVLVTAAVPDDVPADLLGARFDVSAGEVRRVR